MTIYFLSDEQDRLKIGFSGNAKARISDLQSANADTLQLVATEPGDSKRERALHSRFAHLRIRGEWFNLAPDLWKYVKALPGYVYSGPILHRLECGCGRFIYTVSKGVTRGGLKCGICNREFVKP